jgi:hypothetical protein
VKWTKEALGHSRNWPNSKKGCSSPEAKFMCGIELVGGMKVGMKNGEGRKGFGGLEYMAKKENEMFGTNTVGIELDWMNQTRQKLSHSMATASSSLVDGQRLHWEMPLWPHWPHSAPHSQCAKWTAGAQRGFGGWLVCVRQSGGG